jgi:quercetin dioxygenase-like cupin family protein
MRPRRAPARTGGSDDREARALDLPFQRFELSPEAVRLRAERAYVEGDRNARTLVKVGGFRMVLVAFRSGALFDEHDQRGSVALHVLEGRLAVRTDEDAVEIGATEVAAVAARQPWTAVALTDGVVVIHLAWPPEPGSIDA